MTGPLIYVGTHEIQPDKADVAHRASADLVRHLELNHESYLHFQINVSDDGLLMSVLQVHSDEASMVRHLHLAQEKIAAAYDFLAKTTAIQIFGDPSPEVTAMITGMAGDAPLMINRPQHGFSRLPVTTER